MQEQNITFAHGTSILAQGQPFDEYKGNRVENIVISMCDGIGGALLALNTVFASVTRYLAVECHDASSVICNNVNSGAHGGAIPDHTYASRVEDITEQKIKDHGPGNVKHVAFGPPCKGHSKLRLIPRYRSA